MLSRNMLVCSCGGTCPRSTQLLPFVTYAGGQCISGTNQELAVFMPSLNPVPNLHRVVQSGVMSLSQITGSVSGIGHKELGGVLGNPFKVF